MKISRVFSFGLAAVLVAFMGQNAFAQSEKEPGVTPAVDKGNVKPVVSNLEFRLNRLSQQLALTAEQQATIKTILEDEALKLKALRIDTGQNIAEHRTKIRELREATAEKIRALLTPEQQQKQDVLRKETKERRQKRGVK